MLQTIDGVVEAGIFIPNEPLQKLPERRRATLMFFTEKAEAALAKNIVPLKTGRDEPPPVIAAARKNKQTALVNIVKLLEAGRDEELPDFPRLQLRERDIEI